MNIEEKKLTDEEIVKALECCVKEEHKDCTHCGEFVSQFDCMRNAISNALDLIHRLQDENERLTEALKIEQSNRLDLHIQNIELQKQVDEWKTECQELHDECENCWANKKLNSEQAVKDTADEIYDFVKEYYSSDEDIFGEWLKEFINATA